MHSISDPPAPVVYTRDGMDGFPSEAEFEVIIEEYIQGLNPRKREKALMTQAMYDNILAILVHPANTRESTAQFRFWTKKMFRLVTTSHAHVVTHENRPVAVKEQIYDVLVQCHAQCSHGGRDKTSNQVRRYYSWIPKELVARFVKACPACQTRRNVKSAGGSSRTYSNENSSPPSDYTSDSRLTTPIRPTFRQYPSSSASSGSPTELSFATLPSGLPTCSSSVDGQIQSNGFSTSEWADWIHTTPQRQIYPHLQPQPQYQEQPLQYGQQEQQQQLLEYSLEPTQQDQFLHQHHTALLQHHAQQLQQQMHFEQQQQQQQQEFQFQFQLTHAPMQYSSLSTSTNSQESQYSHVGNVAGAEVAGVEMTPRTAELVNWLSANFQEDGEVFCTTPFEPTFSGIDSLPDLTIPDGNVFPFFPLGTPSPMNIPQQ